MAKSAGNTIVVAGGGGAGGGSRGGGGSDGGSSGGGSSSKSKIGGGKLKLDDQLFTTLMAGAIGIGVLVHLYHTNPSLFQGFIDPFKKLIQPQQAVPQVPPGQAINDQIPQAPDPSQGQWGGEMQYPTMPQQNQGSGYPQFQMPGQPQYPQQYQGYNPQQGFGGTGDFGMQGDIMQTQFNPMFGQNSNVQATQSFASKLVKKYDFDSSDGMLKISNAYYI